MTYGAAPSLLTITRKELPKFISQRLKTVPLDFIGKMEQIRRDNAQGRSHLAAGVLLLISFSEGTDEPFFLLIKRSNKVAQGGDLSCPGGILNPALDRFLKFLIAMGIIPSLRGDLVNTLQSRPLAERQLISLFLANALRESWEEIRLSPYKLKFLGTLPSYSLTLFRRTIFPLVCSVEGQQAFRPNHEVDKIIRIPLSSFYRDENFGKLCFGPVVRVSDLPVEFPCLIHREKNGSEEILWGATFNIISNFLHIIADFTVPDFSQYRPIPRILGPNYLGKQGGVSS